MKAELLSGLEDEYQTWLALLDEIGLQRMDRPGVAGDWSIKDVVAHMTGWRRRTVGRLQAVARGYLQEVGTSRRWVPPSAAARRSAPGRP